MQRGKNDKSVPTNRVLPNPDLSGYTPPNLIPSSHLTSGDKAVLTKLRNDLLESGVIDRELSTRDSQSIEEINAIMGEAAQNAKYERELNPEYYDEELDASLQGDLAAEQDWDNPILDGLDDYGNQVHERIDKSTKEMKKDSNPNDIFLELENGKIVRAKII